MYGTSVTVSQLYGTAEYDNLFPIHLSILHGSSVVARQYTNVDFPPLDTSISPLIISECAFSALLVLGTEYPTAIT